MEKYTFFTLSSNIRLRVRTDLNRTCHKWLFVFHGLGEHCERHFYVSDYLKDHFNIVYFDHRGHGMSGGERATIDEFSTYSKDFVELLNYFIKCYDIQDYSMLGHSMGALIICDFYKNHLKNLIAPSAIFLISPPVGLSGVGKVLQYTPSVLTALVKDFPFGFNIEGGDDYKRYSNDPAVLVALQNDPLINQHTESKLMFEIIHASNTIFDEAINFKCPVRVAIGGGDLVVCPQTGFEFFSIKEKVDEILVIPSARHELYMEAPKFRTPFLRFMNDFFLAEAKRVKKVQRYRERRATSTSIDH